MALSALRDDALARHEGRLELRLGLPWIRSMPLACVRQLTVTLDGEPQEVLVALGTRQVPPTALIDETGWWYLQDRLRLHMPDSAPGAAHTVAVDFGLMVPYIDAGTDAPLILPFHLERDLVTDASCRSSSAGAGTEVA